MTRLKIVCDIDGVLCQNNFGDYENAIPIKANIERINKLYDDGHIIQLFTARGTETNTDWQALTEEQMQKWGVKYYSLKFGKPAADVYIDDRAINVTDWEAGELLPKSDKEWIPCGILSQKLKENIKGKVQL